MDEEINILDYLRVINKRRNWIIILAVLFASFAHINSLKVIKMYSAEVTFLPLSSNFGGLAQALSSFSTGGVDQSGGNVETILKSRSLAKEIVLKHDVKKFLFVSRWDDKAQSWIGPEPTIEESVPALQSALKIGDSSKIKTEWSDPEIAAKLANSYAFGLIEFLNQKAIQTNLKILDEAIPSQSPSNKKGKLSIMIGAFTGMFIGVFLAFGMDYYEKIKGKI